MSSTTYDLELQQGATYERTIVWQAADGTPRSLAGLQARLQVRGKLDDAAPVLSLTSEPAAGLVVEPDGETGRLDVRIGADLTGALAVRGGVYDLEVYDPADPSTVHRLLQGRVKLDREVTR